MGVEIKWSKQDEDKQYIVIGNIVYAFRTGVSEKADFEIASIKNGTLLWHQLIENVFATGSKEFPKVGVTYTVNSKDINLCALYGLVPTDKPNLFWFKIVYATLQEAVECLFQEFEQNGNSDSHTH